MKKKLVLISKVLLGIFLLLFLIIIMDIAYHPTGEGADITVYVLFPALFVGALLIVAFFIEFVLEMKEKWKEKGIWLVTELVGQMAIIMAAVMLYNGLILKGKGIMGRYLAVSVAVVVMAKVLDYWRRIGKSHE